MLVELGNGPIPNTWARSPYMPRSIHVFSAHRAGEKPMEDASPKVWRLGNYVVAGVADGATRFPGSHGYPNPSPSALLAELVSNTAMEYVKEQLRQHSKNPEPQNRFVKPEFLLDAIAEANNVAFEFNKHLGLRTVAKADDLHMQLAASSLTLIAIESDSTNIHRLFYSHVLDSQLWVGNPDEGFRLVTPVQSEAFKQVKQALRERDGVSSKDRIEMTRWLKSAILANIPHFPGQVTDWGYGTLNGDPFAQEYFVTGEVMLGVRDCVLLCTDDLGVTDGLLKEVVSSKLPEHVLPQLLAEANSRDDLHIEDVTAIFLSPAS